MESGKVSALEMVLSDKRLCLLVVLLEAVCQLIWRHEGVGGGRQGHSGSTGGRGGAGIRVGGLERGGELVVAVVLNLSLEQLVSGPHQLWVLSQIVSLCSCAVLLLGVPVAQRERDSSQLSHNCKGCRYI